MSYASGSNVAALCRNLVAGAANFASSTCPTLDQVEQWLSSGCGMIEAFLSSEGYNVPPVATTSAYSMLTDIEALYGAARAEMSRSNVRVGPGERTRGQVFDDMFWEALDKLLKMGDLSGIGLSRTSSGRLYAGGISVADKNVDESNTDRVKPRFERGQFQFPGTLRPRDMSSGSGAW